MSDKLSIVIVDDNEIDLMIGERLLSRVDQSIALTKFNHSTEMLNWLQREDENSFTTNTIFLVDIYMPIFNGYYVAEQITQVFDAFDKKAIIYLVSATIEISDNRKLMLNSRVEGYIGKPVTVSLFKELIKKHG